LKIHNRNARAGFSFISHIPFLLLCYLNYCYLPLLPIALPSIEYLYCFIRMPTSVQTAVEAIRSQKQKPGLMRPPPLSASSLAAIAAAAGNESDDSSSASSSGSGKKSGSSSRSSSSSSSPSQGSAAGGKWGDDLKWCRRYYREAARRLAYE